MSETPHSQPNLFDRHALDAHRARSKPQSMFLQQLARDEVEDRLTLVNRTFTKPAIVSGFGKIWENFSQSAKIVTDSEVLDLEPGAHDLVVHAMSLHWANDPVGQLIQCRRALQEDGLLLLMALGGRTLHELRTVLAEAESQLSGGLSPRVSPMAEIRDMGALLQRAGFALPVADVVPQNAEYRDIFHLGRDLRLMGEGNALTSRVKSFTPRRLFEHADTLYHQHFSTPAGRLHATFELVCLTGWCPSDSQPQPLRPGSAKARLADALRVPEKPLPKD